MYALAVPASNSADTSIVTDSYDSVTGVLCSMSRAGI